jgi:predicted amidohydrolase
MLKQMMIAVGQITSGNNVAANLATCSRLINQAATSGAKMLFLPEATDYIGENKEESLKLAQPLDGEFVQTIQSEAQKNNIWVSVCLHEKIPDEPNRIFNTHIIVNDQGTLASVYRKLHLFNVDIEGGPRLMESEGVREGSEFVPPISTPVGKVGLSICYDLRFPEQSIMARNHGADIITFPSAFTVKTGEAHWEVLLRARAIETQCYVVASAQVGQHNAKRASYGHAMIISPWGTVLANLEKECGLGYANISHEEIARIRREMPVWSHRRKDIYGTFN